MQSGLELQSAKMELRDSRSAVDTWEQRYRALQEALDTHATQAQHTTDALQAQLLVRYRCAVALCDAVAGEDHADAALEYVRSSCFLSAFCILQCFLFPPVCHFRIGLDQRR